VGNFGELVFTVERVKLRIFIVLLICVTGCIVLREGLREAAKQARTDDTLSFILQTLCQRLTTNTFSELDVVTETTRLYPKVPTKAHTIVDAWGNPINISIQRRTNGYEIELISAGPDGVIGTHDDRVIKRFLRDNPPE
jgi:hypothetical protein